MAVPIYKRENGNFFHQAIVCVAKELVRFANKSGTEIGSGDAELVFRAQIHGAGMGLFITYSMLAQKNLGIERGMVRPCDILPDVFLQASRMPVDEIVSRLNALEDRYTMTRVWNNDKR